MVISLNDLRRVAKALECKIEDLHLERLPACEYERVLAKVQNEIKDREETEL